MAQKITLNEEQLRKIVAESVKRVMKENFWQSVPGTRAYKNYQAQMKARDQKAHDDLEAMHNERDRRLQRQFANDDQALQQRRNIDANNQRIVNAERNRRFNQSYYDPMCGRTGKSEKDYYGDDYGYVRNGSNNNDWKYGRR